MIEYFLNDIGIVFYNNVVRYPNLLSIQTLPYKLKVEVESKLNAVKAIVPTFKLIQEHPMLLELTKGQIQSITNYLLAEDRSNLWEDCIKFNRRLDSTRNQSFFEVTPAFVDYI